MEKCPVCKKRVEDMRHVSVECFYDVREIVPEMNQEIMFTEVDEGTSYWGVTRHYPEGTRDKWVVTDSTEVEHELEDGYKYKTTNTKIDIEKIPIDKIRLLEKAIYSINCCKHCRHDFMCLLKNWVDGMLVGIQEEFYARKEKCRR